MKAAVWHGRQDVRIEKVKDPAAPPPGQVQRQSGVVRDLRHGPARVLAVRSTFRSTGRIP